MIYSGAYGSAAYGGISGVVVAPVEIQTKSGMPSAILLTRAPGHLTLSTKAISVVALTSRAHDTIVL